jgi:hypothetical protein
MDRTVSLRLKASFPEYGGLFLVLLDSTFSRLVNFMAKGTDINNSDCVYNKTKEQK